MILKLMSTPFQGLCDGSRRRVFRLHGFSQEGKELAPQHKLLAAHGEKKHPLKKKKGTGIWREDLMLGVRGARSNESQLCGRSSRRWRGGDGGGERSDRREGHRGVPRVSWRQRLPVLHVPGRERNEGCLTLICSTGCRLGVKDEWEDCAMLEPFAC